MSIFKQLRDSISVVDYLRGKGYNVKAVGSGHGLDECPFCKGHDCFRVFDNSKRWSCFQCPDRRFGKDVLDLEYYFQQTGYGAAIKSLAESIGVEYKQDELDVISLVIKDKALEYFQYVLETHGKEKEYPLKFRGETLQGTVWDYVTGLRKHPESVIKSARLGMSDGMLMDFLGTEGFKLKEIRAGGLIKNDRDLFKDGLIIYPHFVQGKISHFTCKDPTKRSDPFQTEARFRSDSWRFYNQDFLLETDVEDKSIVLVEGENDLLSVVYKGNIPNVIATIGTISDVQIKALQELSKAGWAFLMAFDGDEQGKKYRNLIIERVGGNIFDIPIAAEGIPEGRDIDDILCDSLNPAETFISILQHVVDDPKTYKLRAEINKSVDTTKKEKIPYSIEHEVYILRNIIRGDNLLEIFERCKEEWFYKTLHKEVFKQLKSLYEDNKNISELIAYTMLRETKAIKTDDEFDEIMQKSLDSDIQASLDILDKKFRRRQFLLFSNQIQSDIEDEAIPIEKLEDKTSEVFFDLYKTRDGTSQEISAKNLLTTHLANEKTFKLIGTPYADINATLVIGFDVGKLVVIGGRTGMGKSIFKTNLKKYRCENGIGVLDFSPENGVKMEQARLDAMLTGVGFKKVWYRVDGDLVDAECQQVHNKIVKNKWPLWQFEEMEHFDIGYIARKVKIAKQERPDIVHWVVVADLANKIKEYDSMKDLWRAVGVANKKMKSLATKLGFCFVAIVQIGRGAEQEKKIAKRRPELHDLKGSGNWEEDADIVFLLFREKYYDASLDSDVIEVALKKQRGGPPGVFNKRFGEDFIKIEDLEEGSYEQLPPQD